MSKEETMRCNNKTHICTDRNHLMFWSPIHGYSDSAVGPVSKDCKSPVAGVRRLMFWHPGVGYTNSPIRPEENK